MTTVLRVFVPGSPITQGSKDAGVNPKTGRVFMRESSPDLKTWRATVAWRARGAWRAAPMTGAVQVEVLFILPRTAALPKRRLPFATPQRSGDVDKLLRAVLDALTEAGIYLDDAQVVDAHPRKRYAKPTERPGAWITAQPCADPALGANPPPRKATP